MHSFGRSFFLEYFISERWCIQNTDHWFVPEYSSFRWYKIATFLCMHFTWVSYKISISYIYVIRIKMLHYFLEIELLDYESWNTMLEKSETEFLSLDHFWADILHCWVKDLLSYTNVGYRIQSRVGILYWWGRDFWICIILGSR